MKVPVLIFMLLLSASSFSQTLRYSYDNAGNRILREIVLSKQRSVESQNQADNPIEEKLADKTIKIYPNPTKGELKVEVANWDYKCSGNIYVYSANGTLIRQCLLVDNIQLVDLSNDPVGLYILKIEIDNNISTWNIIKE